MEWDILWNIFERYLFDQQLPRWWRRSGAGINFLSYDVRTFNNKKSVRIEQRLNNNSNNVGTGQGRTGEMYDGDDDNIFDTIFGGKLCWWWQIMATKRSILEIPPKWNRLRAIGQKCWWWSFLAICLLHQENSSIRLSQESLLCTFLGLFANWLMSICSELAKSPPINFEIRSLWSLDQVFSFLKN